MEKIKKQWLQFAVGGLILNGAGLSVMGEALLLKANAAPFFEWFLWGTTALVLINAGLSLFGNAVVLRVKLELAKKG